MVVASAPGSYVKVKYYISHLCLIFKNIAILLGHLILLYITKKLESSKE